MIAIGTAEHGLQRRRFLRLDNGFEYHKGEWLEASEPASGLSPTAFLVEQPSGFTLPTHFHTQNQFQVVVAGSGTLGPHQVGPIGVHYAGAYTGYGPIVPGEEGLHYFTIRAKLEAGAHFIPQARDKMIRGPKLQRYSAPLTPVDEALLARQASVQTDDLIPAEAGMFARAVRYPAGHAVAVRHEGASSGQFLMVVAGALDCGGRTLRRLEMVFMSPDEVAPPLAAGAGGLQLLVLQLPHRAAEYEQAA